MKFKYIIMKLSCEMKKKKNHTAENVENQNSKSILWTILVYRSKIEIFNEIIVFSMRFLRKDFFFCFAVVC